MIRILEIGEFISDGLWLLELYCILDLRGNFRLFKFCYLLSGGREVVMEMICWLVVIFGWFECVWWGWCISWEYLRLGSVIIF